MQIRIHILNAKTQKILKCMCLFILKTKRQKAENVFFSGHLEQKIVSLIWYLREATLYIYKCIKISKLKVNVLFKCTNCLIDNFIAFSNQLNGLEPASLQSKFSCKYCMHQMVKQWFLQLSKKKSTWNIEDY